MNSPAILALEGTTDFKTILPLPYPAILSPPDNSSMMGKRNGTSSASSSNIAGVSQSSSNPPPTTTRKTQESYSEINNNSREGLLLGERGDISSNPNGGGEKSSSEPNAKKPKQYDAQGRPKNGENDTSHARTKSRERSPEQENQGKGRRKGEKQTVSHMRTDPVDQAPPSDQQGASSSQHHGIPAAAAPANPPLQANHANQLPYPSNFHPFGDYTFWVIPNGAVSVREGFWF